MRILSSLGISRDAEINVAALSGYIVRGVPLLLMKRLNPNTNDSSDKSGISSRWTALTHAHVNKQMYIFFCESSSFTYSGPAKSIPVVTNGIAPLTLSFGNGGGFGLANGRPNTFWHFTQHRKTRFTHCLMAGIQYFWRILVIVCSVPAWSTRECASCTIKSVNGWYFGSKIGYFAESSNAELWILPSQRMIPALSQKRRSCLASAESFLVCRLRMSSRKFCAWMSVIHISSALRRFCDVMMSPIRETLLRKLYALLFLHALMNFSTRHVTRSNFCILLNRLISMTRDIPVASSWRRFTSVSCSMIVDSTALLMFVHHVGHDDSSVIQAGPWFHSELFLNCVLDIPRVWRSAAFDSVGTYFHTQPCVKSFISLMRFFANLPNDFDDDSQCSTIWLSLQNTVRCIPRFSRNWFPIRAPTTVAISSNFGNVISFNGATRFLAMTSEEISPLHIYALAPYADLLASTNTCNVISSFSPLFDSSAK